MDATSQLKLFLEPKSVVVVGAQPHSGEQAFNIMENLAYCCYQGQVYPVNLNSGSDIRNWINLLESIPLEMPDVKDIVPGHLDISSFSDILDQANYFRALMLKVKRIQNQVGTVDDAVEFIELRDYMNYTNYKRFHKPNIRAAWNSAADSKDSNS